LETTQSGTTDLLDDEKRMHIFNDFGSGHNLKTVQISDFTDCPKAKRHLFSEKWGPDN